jgi:hypothetical protein
MCAVQPCVAGDARDQATHGPYSHAWLVTRASKPRTARRGLTLMHVRRPAMHGLRRMRASHAWLGAGSHSCMCAVRPCMAGDACEQATHGSRRAHTDACAPSSHAWLATVACERAMHGWRRARTDACAPSSHAWLETRASKPRMPRGGLTLMHVRSVRPCVAGDACEAGSH